MDVIRNLPTIKLNMTHFAIEYHHASMSTQKSSQQFYVSQNKDEEKHPLHIHVALLNAMILCTDLNLQAAGDV